MKTYHLQSASKIWSQEIDSFLQARRSFVVVFIILYLMPTTSCFMSLTWKVLFAKESYSWTVLPPKVKTGSVSKQRFRGDQKNKMRTSSSLPKSSRRPLDSRFQSDTGRLVVSGKQTWVKIGSLSVFPPKEIVKTTKKASLFRPAKKSKMLRFVFDTSGIKKSKDKDKFRAIFSSRGIAIRDDDFDRSSKSGGPIQNTKGTNQDPQSVCLAICFLFI